MALGLILTFDGSLVGSFVGVRVGDEVGLGPLTVGAGVTGLSVGEEVGSLEGCKMKKEHEQLMLGCVKNQTKR